LGRAEELPMHGLPDYDDERLGRSSSSVMPRPAAIRQFVAGG